MQIYLEHKRFYISYHFHKYITKKLNLMYQDYFIILLKKIL
jgi:hypothetical protein